jgi:hypothetical protein
VADVMPFSRPRPSFDKETQSMSRPDRSNALDHVVVIMFENRSLDNLLGRLYEPGEVKSFEGVLGKNLSNPIPEWAEHGADRRVVPHGIAKTMDTPNPDSGEEYPHINTQIFGLIDPPGNRGISYAKMVAPYNAPADVNARPTMDGFVVDYISTFTSEMGRQPTYEEYSQIMTGHTPEQVPVTSALARGLRPSITGSARFLRKRSPIGRSFTRALHPVTSLTPLHPTHSRCTTPLRQSSNGLRRRD